MSLKRWTAEDDAELKRLVALGTKSAAIARDLARTKGSVATRMGVLGLHRGKAEREISKAAAAHIRAMELRVLKAAACAVHHEVGEKVRQTMRELSGILLENLPVEEDVERIAAEERKQQKQRVIPAPAHAPAISANMPGSAPTPVAINLNADLWKYALLIMSVRPEGEMSTSHMIAEMPSYVRLSEQRPEPHLSKEGSKFSRIVRNLKSHKNSKTNFIYEGFAQAVPGGFKITQKGIDFVRGYFKI